MVVLILETVPTSLRGEVSRWLMEVRAGVFIGHVSALVRDALWDLCVEKMRLGGAMLVHTYPSEQGFKVRRAGNLSRELVDFEGLYLMRRVPKPRLSEDDVGDPDEVPF